MSAISAEWLVVLLFVFLFAGVVVAEILWLTKKGWATTGRAIAYVLITNFLGFGIGSFVIMGVLLVILMMTFGPSGRGSDAPEAAYWLALVLAVIVPPAFLFLAKRAMLALLKIKAGKTAWVYSLLSSLVIMLVVLVPPPVATYIIWYVLSWK